MNLNVPLQTATTPAAAPSGRARLRRRPERGAYDAGTVNAILDEALICHVGVVDDGCPVVVPTIHARLGSALYLHGSPGSRMLRIAGAGADLCVTATIVDGLVLARSALHHSMNYRSVVVLGPGQIVRDTGEKRAALDALVEHVAPGRAAEVRPPTEAEIASTKVVRIDLVEASAKVRAGDVVDDDGDLTLPIWAGVVPIRLATGPPEPDRLLQPGVAVPAHVVDLAGSPRHRR